MSVVYKGIELEGLDKKVGMVHSVVLASMGQDRNENTDYLDKILEFKRADLPQDQFDEINKLYSVVKMNYQICNGGIYQYFGNKFHEHYLSENKEVELFDKDTQVEMLYKLCEFAGEVFPDKQVENSKLMRMTKFFESLSFEESVPQYGTVYSDEDEEIWDEDLEEWVQNPDYEEPYEDIVDYEDEISTDLVGFYADDFDDEYYQINEYLEAVIEGYAQFVDKSIDKERSVEKASLDSVIQSCEAINKKQASDVKDKSKDSELEI